MPHTLPMKMRRSIALMLVFALIACAEATIEGREICTVEAVGIETGAGSLEAALYVPESFLRGADIANGGVSVLDPDCDFPLNAFISDETANYIIEHAPKVTVGHREGGFRVVGASLSIWKFTDGSGETRFFVTGVREMRAASLKTSDTSEYR